MYNMNESFNLWMPGYIFLSWFAKGLEVVTGQSYELDISQVYDI